MNDSQERYQAVIAGKTYTILGQRPKDHLDAVTDLVNQQLDQLHELSPDLSIIDRAILMAINAVSDQMVKEGQLIELEVENDQLRKELKTLKEVSSQKKSRASNKRRYQSNHQVAFKNKK